MVNQSLKDPQLNSPNLLLISLLEKVKLLSTSKDIPNLPQIVRLILLNKSTSMASNPPLNLSSNSAVLSTRLKPSGPIPFSFLSKIPS